MLISLIGVGVSPCVSARTDDRIVGMAQSGLDAALEEQAVTALDRTRWAPGLEWRTEEWTLAIVQPQQTLRASVAAVSNPDWAPGEMPEGPQTSIAPAPRAEAATPEAAKPEAPKTKAADAGWRPAKVAKVTTAKTKAAKAKGATSKAARAEAAEAARRIAKLTEARVRGMDRVLVLIDEFAAKQDALEAQRNPALARIEPLPVPVQAVNAAPALPSDAHASSVHADRLLEALAAVVLEEVPPSSDAVARSNETEPVRAAIAESAAPRTQVVPSTPTPRSEASAQRRIEPPAIVVAAQSSKVLRTLEALLFDERDEVGAISADPIEKIVTTQADKVFASLFEFSSPPVPVEDGAAKRARKFAAAKLRAEAAAAAAAAKAEADATAAAAMARASKPRASPFGGTQVAISEHSLDGVRGGFITDSVKISFGIERAVYINGALVTTTSLNVSDLGRISAGRGTTAFDSGTLALIQSGAGNLVSTGALSAASVATVVQNTLDGQKIQNMTVINATVNSLGVLRGINLQSSLRGAIIDSLRR